MRAILLMVLWTWGLTPLWVNVASTVIVAAQLLLEEVKERL